MAKKRNSISYTDEQIAEEIRKIRGQVDMMEHLLEMYEERYYNGQRNFSIAHQMSVEETRAIKLSWKQKAVRKGYRLGKFIMEKTHLDVLFKKTKLYQKLAENGSIYAMATGHK